MTENGKVTFVAALAPELARTYACAMSDAATPARRATTDTSRVTVNRDQFLTAFAAKGCATGQERANLIGTSRRLTERYVAGEVVPTLTTARRIARRLNRTIDDLWPDNIEAAA